MFLSVINLSLFAGVNNLSRFVLNASSIGDTETLMNSLMYCMPSSLKTQFSTDNLGSFGTSKALYD